MTEQRLMLVAFAAACFCLLEARGAQVSLASHKTICSSADGVGGCRSSRGHTSHSTTTGSDGITKGVCIYSNAAGDLITINYQKHPDGTVNAEASNTENDPIQELEQCFQAVQEGQQVAQEEYTQVQEENQQLYEEIQRENQQLQDEIFRQSQELQNQLRRQQEALFNQRNFPLPIAFNPIQFPNFNQHGLNHH